MHTNILSHNNTHPLTHTQTHTKAPTYTHTHIHTNKQTHLQTHRDANTNTHTYLYKLKNTQFFFTFLFTFLSIRKYIIFCLFSLQPVKLQDYRRGLQFSCISTEIKPLTHESAVAEWE